MGDMLAEALLRYTDSQSGESPFATAIDGLVVMRSDHPKPQNHMLSRPAMCIVAQGAKWGTFGGNRLEYRAGQALVVGVETPSVGQVVQASPDEPCLVLAFELDLAIMRSVADELDAPPRPSGRPAQGVFVTDFQGRWLTARCAWCGCSRRPRPSRRCIRASCARSATGC
jgi:hypothetical protein